MSYYQCTYLYVCTSNSRFSIVNWWSPDTETRLQGLCSSSLLCACRSFMKEDMQGTSTSTSTTGGGVQPGPVLRNKEETEMGSGDIWSWGEEFCLIRYWLSAALTQHTTHDTIIVTDRKFEMSVFVMLLVSGWRLKCLSVGVRVSQF